MKPTWKIGLALTGIVLVSLAVGVDIGFHWAAAAGRKRSNPVAWNQSIMEMLQHRLKLSPEQRSKVQAHLDQRVGELATLREETVAKTNGLMETLIADVGGELTPEQRVEFAKLTAKRAQTTLDTLKVAPPKPK